ncbi:MAG: RNA polymerase factor sigma-54 [Acidobacteria bacterium]|nr:RNA polymerase factor sigma-54 [Acidobacteriota bacterium]MCG2815440.1 RNA polymerase factor sigma-54 [Candidatus Aminicenantes bacterium]MBU1338344.1 RNA polymerase factor sigma-54 [Acidobacteriota bacterium]MBU1475519.1 RNA polymerase factor sigma-54 [Acidobacteriota bacterium]MBU4253077.1 RNA polymerase factor sigma-54 [Acidobacteriota bacterium]
MALKQQLHQKQVQRLILAPALQQAIKLLPLTNLELIEIIDQELSENPLLEVKEESAENNEDLEKGAKDSSEPGAVEGPVDEESDLARALGLDGKDDDRDIQKYFQEYFDDGFRTYSQEKKEAPVLENFISKSISLWDHLEWQANLTFSEDREKEIAQYVIGNINGDGYLMTTEDEIADTLDCEIDMVRSIREKIKTFDPVGTGSLSLEEVLIAQMEYLNIEDELLRTIITEHLHLLEKSDFAQLSKVLGVSLEDIKTRIDIIKGFNPTPGVKYSEEKTQYIVPDIIVRKEDGELTITINDEGLPHLRISNFYKKLMAQSSRDKTEAYPFLKDRLKKAFWFMRSLDQRNQTIFKVAKYIVDAQTDFIEKGLEFIKPLTLMELAEEIGVHESTVGRVVSNKYIMTPRGVFPLKYFFHKSLTGDYGEEISSLRVKERLKKMVENEDNKNPLSDIEIEQQLAKENFKIARRTVAKYRKQLRIEPSHIRKRKYWMEEST